MASDPVFVQFGALQKLIEESAKADMQKQVALQRFQIGQAQAQMMAQQEVQQAQAEMDAQKQAAASQPQQPFQIQLPENGAIAERPVQWKNPLSQLAGNAFSQVAQAGAAGPGAAIQEALQSTAGAVPGAADQMLSGLNMMGPTQTTTTTDVGAQPMRVGQQEIVFAPTMNQRTQETPNALTVQDQAQLRAAILDRIMQIQAAQQKAKEAPQFDGALFRQQLSDLENVDAPAEVKSRMALAVAMGDSKTAAELAAGLPKARAPFDPARTRVAQEEHSKALAKIEERDTQIPPMEVYKNDLDRAISLIENGMLHTGIARGSKLGQLFDRLGDSGEHIELLNKIKTGAFIETAQSLRGLNKDINQNEGKLMEAPLPGPDKDIDYNLRELKLRRAIVTTRLRQAIKDRGVQARIRDNMVKETGLSEAIPETIAREEVELPPEVLAGAGQGGANAPPDQGPSLQELLAEKERRRAKSK